MSTLCDNPTSYMQPQFVSLIPARSGSIRIQDKNMMLVGGQSLIARSVSLSISCPSINNTFIVTDSKKYEDHALTLGAESVGLRPLEISLAESPDIEWMKWILSSLIKKYPALTHYLILRPTSPFRSVQFVEKAISKYINSNPSSHTTLRCVSSVNQHPFKMWTQLPNNRMSRLYPFAENGIFFSDQQSSIFPKVYIQNAALEIGNIRHILDSNSSSGSDVICYIQNGYEVFDINTPDDLEFAEFLVTSKGL